MAKNFYRHESNCSSFFDNHTPCDCGAFEREKLARIEEENKKPFTIFKAAMVCFQPKQLPDIKRIGFSRWFAEMTKYLQRAGSSLIEARWNYVVIEEVMEGAWDSVVEDSERWLVWEGEQWVSCERPEQAGSTVNWTI